MIASLDARENALTQALDALGSRIVGDIGGRTIKAEEVLTTLIDRLEEVDVDPRQCYRVKLPVGDHRDRRRHRGECRYGRAPPCRVPAAKRFRPFRAASTKFAVMLDSRLNAMDNVVADKGERLINRLGEHTEKFDVRAGLLEAAIEEKTDRLGSTLNERGEALASAITDRTAALDEAIINRTSALDETITAPDLRPGGNDHCQDVFPRRNDHCQDVCAGQHDHRPGRLLSTKRLPAAPPRSTRL